MPNNKKMNIFNNNVIHNYTLVLLHGDISLDPGILTIAQNDANRQNEQIQPM